MGLTKWTETFLKPSEHNANDAFPIVLSGMNTIRQLIDRAGVWSAGMIEGWADAYIDSNGRENSVTGGTAIFATDRFAPDVIAGTVENANTDTTNGSSLSYNYDVTIVADGFFSAVRIASSGSNFATENLTIKKNGVIVATKSASSAVNDYTFTLTSSDYNEFLRVGDTVNIAISVSGTNSETQSGVSYSQTNFTSSSVTVNSSTGGDELSYTPITVDTTPFTIIHTIPSGTFATAIELGIGVPLIAEWETGANIEYKLSNGSDDSGWLSCSNAPEVSTFTAFGAGEPTTLTVRLTSKTGGLAGLPSIKGFWNYSE